MSTYIPRLPRVFNVILSLLLLDTKARAQQIQGCDLVPCAYNNYGQQFCSVGNITTYTIGVTNFTTSLSPDPFTWTTTISMSQVPGNYTAGFYERGYLLGLPPNFDPKSVRGFTGCALFFDEITSKLKFPGNDTDIDIGTCQDAMGASCVADLQSQTRSILANLSSSATETGSNICTDLESALRDNAPATCKFVQGGSWGAIHAREIQQATFPDALELTSCHPTTGANYSIRLIDTYDAILSASYTSEVGAFTSGVTPIFTILLPQNLTELSTDSSSTKVELNLSCVKPLRQQTGPTMVRGGGASALYSVRYSSFAIGMITGLFGLSSIL